MKNLETTQTTQTTQTIDSSTLADVSGGSRPPWAHRGYGPGPYAAWYGPRSYSPWGPRGGGGWGGYHGGWGPSYYARFAHR